MTLADQRETRLVAEPDAGKLASPTELEPRTWRYVARRTLREFTSDECTDLAAALTYYAVLAVLPAAIALLSLLGLVEQSDDAVDEVLSILSTLGGGSIVDGIEPTLTELSRSQAAGPALVLGLAGALWSASGYVGAFGRAMNRIYEIGEGRPIWKLRPAMLVLTVVLVVLAAAVLLTLVLTGPVALAVGDALGLGASGVLIWDIVKWPVLLAVVVVIVALLYYATPNIRQPRFRWVSVGAVLAIVIWSVLTAGFGFYVATVGSYDRTYGALAGMIVFLLWLWLTNLALLFGAELNSELERGRELQSGVAAEETIQLPPRDTRQLAKSRAAEEKVLRKGRELRHRRHHKHRRHRNG
ncbi:YihY/virulence factor BrkB family protein [Nocardioides sp.]|uniref:YihY/virulence factor BrkB family protein n=1 Tax=Nocardioides sp. TaxID=35761 RepID=UPI002D7E2CFA|nr:YihY/virulence factor BrkB family protein [Nocardioides sp.]HET8961371.1 YihY/virulence factor BrkB family protein [Nocardioides sp.]